jgi:hypothetical protein
MNKDILGKSISKGNVRQRAIILMEDYARDRSGLKPLLTSGERDAIFNSFKTTYEKTVYNDILKAFNNMNKSIIALQGASFSVALYKEKLVRYIYNLDDIHNTEEAVNIILNEIRDVNERKRLAEMDIKFIEKTLTFPQVDAEGFIKISTNYQRSEKSEARNFSDLIQNLNNTYITILSQYNGVRKAITDYIEETGVVLNTWKIDIEVIDKRAWEGIFLWTEILDPDTPTPKRNKTGRIKNIPDPLKNIPDKPEDVEPDKEAYNLMWGNLH